MDISSKILEACSNNDIKCLESLLACKITFKISCIIEVLAKGQSEFLYSLFKYPFFVNSIINNPVCIKEIILESNYSVTVLHSLTYVGANFKLVNDLSGSESIILNLVKKNLGLGLNVVIQSGLDLSVTDAYCNTALHFAASEGLCSAVKRLSAAVPATVDHVNSSGLTPLHILLAKGHATCGCLRELLMRSVRARPCFIHELISAVRCPKLDRHLSVFQLWIECNLLKETSDCSQDLDLSTTESLLAQLENDTRDNSKDHEVGISLFLVKLAISVFQSTSSNQCLHLIFGANGLARWNGELANRKTVQDVMYFAHKVEQQSLAKHCGAHSPMPLRYLLIRFIRQYLQRLAALNPNESMTAHFINSVQQLPLPSIIKDSLSLAHLRVVL